MDDRSLRTLATISIASVLIVAAIGVYLLATGDSAGWTLLAFTLFVLAVLGFGQWLRKRQ